MSSLETTEMKLRTTPTGGVAGEHSPYYRRLLSAGYKGLIQGTIGGAGFYGALGLAIGTLIAIPAMVLVPGLGLGALMMIPAAGGLGVAKGASTFGNIGSIAAINAESADMAEQRRILLDRYYELPDGPEGDKQAELIMQELNMVAHPEPHHPLFHWKTVAVGALIGGALALSVALAVASGGASIFADTALFHTVAEVLEFGGVHALGAHAVGATVVTAIGTAVGALAGATIGIDRHYIRHWFDGAEKLLHDEGHANEATHKRSLQVQRLREAAKADHETQRILERRREMYYPESATLAQAPAPVPVQPAVLAGAEQPSPKIHAAQYEQRVQQAMQVPAL